MAFGRQIYNPPRQIYNPRQSYNPQQSYGRGVAQTALARWLGTQRQAQTQFARAEKPLQQSVQMFQRGGGYGRGQAMLLQEQARQAQAEALSSQVATGMSSGSLATGTGLRVKRDLAQGLAGVEDVRTQFLAQALQSLSGLRGQRAQTTATISDPTYAPYMSYLGGAENRATQERMALIQTDAAQRQAHMRSRSAYDAQQTQLAIAKMRNEGLRRTQTQSGTYDTMRY